MKTKFTPGPWHTGEPFETFPGAGLRFHISQAEGAPYTPHYSDVAQFVAETISSEKLAIQQANARLIAAAPELLQALEDLKSELVLSDVDPGYIESHFRPSLNKAAAAIAKAMGDRLGQLAAESAIAKAKGEQQ